MGPRSEDRGNIGACVAYQADQLQWGRDLKIAEMPAQGCLAIGTRFNGAAI
jgi:hypothetical protein